MAKSDTHNTAELKTKQLRYFLLSKSNFGNFELATRNCPPKTHSQKSHNLQNDLKSGSDFAIWVMNLAQATCLVSYQIYSFPTWADKKWKHRTITACKKEASGGKGSRPNVSKILRMGQCLYTNVLIWTFWFWAFYTKQRKMTFLMRSWSEKGHLSLNTVLWPRMPLMLLSWRSYAL